MTLNQRTGAMMRQLRQRAGHTLDDVAAAKPSKGLSRSVLSALERGKGRWYVDRIEALCAFYGADWREVFNG